MNKQLRKIIVHKANSDSESDTTSYSESDFTSVSEGDTYNSSGGARRGNVKRITLSRLTQNKRKNPKPIKYETDTNTETSDSNSETTVDRTNSRIHESKRITRLSEVEQPPKRGPSIQDLMTTDEIKHSLKDCIPLQSKRDKQILTTLPLFKTWIKYINRETLKFRVGGLLMKVKYPEYITVFNPYRRISWSVQLDDNIIFIRDPSKPPPPKNPPTKEQQQEIEIKNKLYKLYLDGELIRRSVKKK